MKRALLLLNTIFLAIGGCGGPMIMRLYFIHGGNRLWLSSWLETGGWPIYFIPLLINYLQRRRKEGSTAKLYFIGGPVFVASTVIGVLTGFDDYLYAYGVAFLPVSTGSLVLASQLGFTAIFAFLVVKQKFTPYSINAIALLTVGAGVLALHTSSDRPKGESNKDYNVGLIMMLAAAALYGLILPLVELTYKKARQVITYTVVLEMQLAIPREAREFGLGETTYYSVLVISGIVWQGFYIGAIGVIFASSTLFSAIIIAVLLPLTEILAVIFYKEKFTAEKWVSLVLSLWGCVSYFYGELKCSKEKSDAQTLETEMPLAAVGGNTGKSMGLDEDDISDTNKSVGEGNDAAAAYDEHMTPAERRYMEQKERIDVHRLAKIANKSHRDRIQDFNQYLTNMSEHYDIPKVGPG
ncbi:hypothetical protein RHSIM_Rhsim07G0208100 [Rhododendron simsii]|uniref:Probable purine permease n=1 Tax=Rhododendron simsii TaxID=118357 RepID=A0A834LJ76_RHOSS|nr:hypothetical protein RHSIM_Rhsim07G0208100 [Rhododendron simsii]